MSVLQLSMQILPQIDLTKETFQCIITSPVANRCYGMYIKTEPIPQSQVLRFVLSRAFIAPDLTGKGKFDRLHTCRPDSRNIRKNTSDLVCSNHSGGSMPVQVEVMSCEGVLGGGVSLGKIVIGNKCIKCKSCWDDLTE
jgi:hypothetical protein